MLINCVKHSITSKEKIIFFGNKERFKYFNENKAKNFLLISHLRLYRNVIDNFNPRIIQSDFELFLTKVNDNVYYVKFKVIHILFISFCRWH